MGQPVIVENKGGAGGDIGTDVVAKAPKDGYTIGFASPGPLVFNPLMRKSMPFAWRTTLRRHAARHRAQRAARQSRRAGEDPDRTDRLHQGQSRQGELRVAGRQHERASRRRALQAPHRHRHPAHSLQGQRGSDDRRPWRPHSDALHRCATDSSCSRASCARSPWRTSSDRSSCPISRRSPKRGCRVRSRAPGTGSSRRLERLLPCSIG